MRYTPSDGSISSQAILKLKYLNRILLSLHTPAQDTVSLVLHVGTETTKERREAYLL